MANYLSTTMTAGPVKSISAGVNWNFDTYTLAQTGSGSLTICMIRLPGGAKVVDCYVNNTSSYGTGAETLCVKDHLGHTYIKTAAMSTSFHAFNPTNDSIGQRLTSSSHLIVSMQGLVGTLSSSLTISLAVGYLSENDKD